MTRYRTIVADPPWPLNGFPGRPRNSETSLRGIRGSSKREPGQTSLPRSPLPYPTMTVEEISSLLVPADDSAHLYLWTVNRFVPQAYDVAQAWGFTPSTLLVWAKNPKGLGPGGAYAITTEFVLYARKGSLPPLRREVTTWFNWKRPHDERGKPKGSAKPPQFFDLVMTVSPGPYLEMFARVNRMGWDAHGNEAPIQHVEIEAAA